ncbi:MAG TPA: hypothetical protein GXX20_01675 [Clostridiaceae bacterium]|nr:hypothetical protein [Clostridiaceae bacterium]
MNRVRVGLLPFYLKMHDDYFPERRAEAKVYLNYVISKLKEKGLDVFETPICSEKREFEAAVDYLNSNNLDAVITLHIVYSPSLESIDSLMRLNAPIIVLNTTPDYDFGEKRISRMIRPNIGIHGVQDMCSMLNRNKIKYWVVAGHIDYSDVLDRLLIYVNAAKMAKLMKTAKVGIIGGSYKGMGDFFVAPERLKKEIGIEIIPFDFENDTKLLNDIYQDEVVKEIKSDLENYSISFQIDKDYVDTVKACLLTRKWIEKNNLIGFTANFMAITQETGFPRMPFMEASKAMARGVGYAGEGDTLTAALVGTLLHAYPQTSFTEMFCPGWSDNTIFLSHMGEMNISLCEGKPVIAKMNMIFSDTGDVVCAYGKYKSGEAAIVNLTPLDKGYRMIIAPGVIVRKPDSEELKYRIEGWFRPKVSVVEFLEKFSILGGTHHSAVCYEANMQELIVLGEMMGFEVKVID